MPDYGHPITFGLSLYPSVDLVDGNTRLAQEADEAGLDYIAIQDHAYNREFLDTWTLISYLAAETERVTFVPDVLDLQLRPPTITAKAAASLSVLSGGRIILGVGGGARARERQPRHQTRSRRPDRGPGDDGQSHMSSNHAFGGAR
jgi:alkanesulfonate monooxygenase SsuD/methylene tetrahydromethanopterin reductase-like flavin-dependent oxidoreductase (luciferase family)